MLVSFIKMICIFYKEFLGFRKQKFYFCIVSFKPGGVEIKIKVLFSK